MIMEWGMSDRLGPMIFGEHQEQIFLGKQLGSERNYGETVATIIDEEMHKYLDEAYNDTMRILTEIWKYWRPWHRHFWKWRQSTISKSKIFLNITLSMRREKSRSKRNRNFHHLPWMMDMDFPLLQINLTLKGLGIAQVFLAPLRK